MINKRTLVFPGVQLNRITHSLHVDIWAPCQSLKIEIFKSLGFTQTNQKVAEGLLERNQTEKKKAFQEKVFSHQRIETAMATAFFFFFHFLKPCQHQTHPGTFQPA